LAGHYFADGAEVYVSVVGYWRQRQGSELIYYANRPIPDRDLVLSASSSVVALAGGGELPIGRFKVEDSGGRQRMVWLSYEVAGIATHNALLAKLYQALGSLRGRRDAQAIVMSAPCRPNC